MVNYREIQVKRERQRGREAEECYMPGNLRGLSSDYLPRKKISPLVFVYAVEISPIGKCSILGNLPKFWTLGFMFLSLRGDSM
jgi:hypothetical protein